MNNKLKALSNFSKEDLIVAMDFMKNTLNVCCEEKFHKGILDFAQYFGYEYVLYGYMKAAYSKMNQPCIVNISNPKEWAEEYDNRGYYECDPVIFEVEHRELNESKDGYILWDSYDRELSQKELEVINRRKFYGLMSGFSAYENSRNKDFTFLVSFGSGDSYVSRELSAIMSVVIPHMSSARKKLDILQLISLLSKREMSVSNFLAEGLASCEIALEMDISEATVKFHLTNIYRKLGVSGRQKAISIILASRYLCSSD